MFMCFRVFWRCFFIEQIVQLFFSFRNSLQGQKELLPEVACLNRTKAVKFASIYRFKWFSRFDVWGKINLLKRVVAVNTLNYSNIWWVLNREMLSVFCTLPSTNLFAKVLRFSSLNWFNFVFMFTCFFNGKNKIEISALVLLNFRQLFSCKNVPKHVLWFSYSCFEPISSTISCQSLCKLLMCFESMTYFLLIWSFKTFFVISPFVLSCFLLII